jgi:hypothetical protein
MHAAIKPVLGATFAKATLDWPAGKNAKAKKADTKKRKAAAAASAAAAAGTKPGDGTKPPTKK